MSLANAKVGDTLVVTSSRALGDSRYLAQVARLTKTQVITEDGERFRKNNGRVVGQHDSWYFTTADIATEKDIESIRRRELWRRIAHLHRKVSRDIPIEAIEKILAAYKAAPLNTTTLR